GCRYHFASEAVTSAPRDCKKSAEATPERPSPTTSTRLPITSKLFTTAKWRTLQNQYAIRSPHPRLFHCLCGERLSQFQGSQCEQRKHQRRNPESHDDLRLRPSHQLKVMMDWRHFEDSLFAQLVRRDLQNS